MPVPKTKTWVAVLKTHIGEDLVLRSNPKEEEIFNCIAEINRRYHAGEPAGPSGIPPYLVHSVIFFEDDRDRYAPETQIGTLDVSEFLTTESVTT